MSRRKGFLRVENSQGAPGYSCSLQMRLEATEVVIGLQTCTLIQGSDLNQVLLPINSRKLA